MQTGKRILALIGAILLMALFGVTIFLAMSGSVYTFDVLMVSIVACAIIPAMIWVYQWIYKVMTRRRNDNNPTFPSSTKESETDDK